MHQDSIERDVGTVITIRAVSTCFGNFTYLWMHHFCLVFGRNELTYDIFAMKCRGDDVPGSRFRGFDIDSSESISLNELKRKQPELDMETPSDTPQKTNVDGRSSSQSNGRGSHKSNKREKKYDFNHLRQKK